MKSDCYITIENQRLLNLVYTFNSIRFNYICLPKYNYSCPIYVMYYMYSRHQLYQERRIRYIVCYTVQQTNFCSKQLLVARKQGFPSKQADIFFNIFLIDQQLYLVCCLVCNQMYYAI